MPTKTEIAVAAITMCFIVLFDNARCDAECCRTAVKPNRKTAAIKLSKLSKERQAVRVACQLSVSQRYMLAFLFRMCNSKDSVHADAANP